MDALAPELLSSLTEADRDAQQQGLKGLRLGAFSLVRELGRGGRPWLALEYVDGLDLKQYCDQNRLNIAQRLQLFLTVCDAVSHAHARLVVHRDLKPSNLLVTATGTVKLLDFGIAKLIAPDAKISQTRIFTPEYAAPEQVRGEVITTSVDVYALGLLLYGLLTGRHPYKLQNSTPAAYERAILEQEPTRPSVALSLFAIRCASYSTHSLCAPRFTGTATNVRWRPCCF